MRSSGRKQTFQMSLLVLGATPCSGTSRIAFYAALALCTPESRGSRSASASHTQGSGYPVFPVVLAHVPLFIFQFL